MRRLAESRAATSTRSSSPHRVAVAVVDLLEAVEVEHHERGPTLISFGSVELEQEGLVQRAAVEEPRQWVGAQEPGGCCLCLPEALREHSDADCRERPERRREQAVAERDAVPAENPGEHRSRDHRDHRSDHGPTPDSRHSCDEHCERTRDSVQSIGSDKQHGNHHRGGECHPGCKSIWPRQERKALPDLLDVPRRRRPTCHSAECRRTGVY